MPKNIVTNSHLLEYIALGSVFSHCCVLLFEQDLPLDTKLLLYVYVLATLFVNHNFRGTRVHLWPLMTGFGFYSIALLFGIIEEIAFYYYYLTCLGAIVLVYFFGSAEFYQGFATSGRYKVGCKETSLKVGGNRVLVYYPTEASDSSMFKDMLWAYDGDHILKGLKKFSAGIMPESPFKYILSLKQKVLIDAPLASLTENDKHKGKYIPMIFSPGVGNTMTWFSSICKDLASQGHIVYSFEHMDATSLHYYDETKAHKYYKSFDMRDQNKIVMKLGIRTKEIHGFIDEIELVTKSLFGQANLDMDQLTVIGHGLGATTAVSIGSKDERIKKIITLDPWLTPIKEEIASKTICVKQPHCSINSELFQGNFSDNWEVVTKLYKGAQKNCILSMLNGIGHMAFTDLPLILQLELRLVTFTPSFSQVFRGRENIRLILGVIKAFLIQNGMCKESGNYEELIKRLESTKDVTFDVK